MISEREPPLVFMSKTASREGKLTAAWMYAQIVGKSLDSTTIPDFSFYQKQIHELGSQTVEKTVIAVSGDGFFQKVVKGLSEVEFQGLVVKIEAGSQDGTNKALRDEHQVLTPKEVVSYHQNSLRKVKKLYPGMIGSHYFHHGGGTGNFLYTQVRFTEWARHILPRALWWTRGYIGGISAIADGRVELDSDQRYSLRLFLTSHFMGRVKLPIPSVDLLDSQSIAELTVSGSTPRRAKLNVLLLSFFSALKILPPKSLCEVSIGNRFELEAQGNSLVLDGEAISIDQNQQGTTFQVKRSPHGLIVYSCG